MDVIVVASSEPSVHEALRVLLGEKYIVVPVYTLPELLSAVVEQPVDVIILDEFLGNVNCSSVFQRLQPLSPDTPCIMLALQLNSELAREMRARHVYDVVAKPFDKDALRASVARALEKSYFVRRLAAVEQTSAHTTIRPGMAAPPMTEQPTLQRREMHESLRTFLKAISNVADPERLHTLVIEAVAEVFALNKAVLLLYNEETQGMTIRSAVGLEPLGRQMYTAGPWSGMATWLIKHNQTCNLDDAMAGMDVEEMLAVRKELELLQARICVPLIAGGRMMGVLAVGRKVTGRALSEIEVEFLYLLAQQIASIMESARYHRTVFVQKKRYEEILQGVTSGLIAVDSEGHLVIFNKAAESMLGLKATHVMGKHVQRVGSVFADIVLRTLREEKSFCRHEVVDPKTGALLGLSTSLLTDTDGKPIGAVVLFTDLSTVSGHPSEISDEMWQRCALCLAQEIKNPLVAIRTFTQLFPESYSDENFRNEFSDIALREIDKLDGIVERLLRFSQPIDLRAEADDIHSVIDEEISRVEEMAKNQNVVVQKVFELANGHIPFDRFLLKEALVQILDNALESMPSGGTLTVSTRTRQYPDPQAPGQGNGIPPGPVAEIVIVDTGMGIAPEELPNLFKPFHTGKVKGMGLGLPISRRIIREHSGDITVTSTPNGGTTVTVILPQRKTPNA